MKELTISLGRILAARPLSWRLPTWQAVREFCAFHGLWAPGIRLLRRLSMRAKASLLVAAFAVPLVALSASLLLRQFEDLDRIRARQFAVEFGEASVQLSIALLADRMGLAAGDPSAESQRRALEARFDPLADEALARGWIGRPTLDALRDQRVRVSGLTQADPAARGEAIEALRRYHRRLLGEVFLDSGLTSSRLPEVVSLSETSLLHLPDLEQALVEAKGRVASAGAVEPGALATAPRALWQARQQAKLELALSELVDQHGNDPQAVRLQALVDDVNRAVDQLGSGSAVAALDNALASSRTIRNSGVEALRLRLAERFGEANRALWAVWGALGGALLLVAYLLVAFLRVVSGGIRMIEIQLERISEGDLSARFSPRGRDEVASALNQLSDSLRRLADLMSAVRQGLGAVHHASEQIASGNTALNRRTDAAAGSIRQILQGVTAYTEELDRGAALVADAGAAVDKLRLDATRSRKHMDRLTERMASLHRKSREIGDIVSLIDGIAFRTNILALNASVEASKAGDAGRGFAVVAQEVRTLALRSANSAQRIHDIVAQSAEDIEQGHALAAQAHASLADTTRHVEQIHTIVSGVATLTRAGQEAAAAITDEVRTLDGSTRENTALVEQLATASGGLRRQADRLERKVKQFNLP